MNKLDRIASAANKLGGLLELRDLLLHNYRQHLSTTSGCSGRNATTSKDTTVISLGDAKRPAPAHRETNAGVREPFFWRSQTCLLAIARFDTAVPASRFAGAVSAHRVC